MKINYYKMYCLKCTGCLQCIYAHIIIEDASVYMPVMSILMLVMPVHMPVLPVVFNFYTIMPMMMVRMPVMPLYMLVHELAYLRSTWMNNL